MDTEAQPHVAAAENGNGNGAHHNNDEKDTAKATAEPGLRCSLVQIYSKILLL